MTKVLVTIVIVFLICHGLKTFVQIFIGSCEVSSSQCDGMEWHTTILSFSNFLVILGSSTNIIIYAIITKNFPKKCSKTTTNWIEATALEETGRNEMQAINSFIV